ncbi:MAG: CHASE2 domain-containing protein [Hyphomicrobiaceae bacterium]
MNDAPSRVADGGRARSHPPERPLPPLRNRIVAGIVWSLLVALAILGIERAELLPPGINETTVDWRTYYLSERALAPRSDIAVIVVGERSLEDYAYVSPVDRALLANLIREVDGARPRAIGLDIILNRASEPAKDEALVSAIREVGSPLVLGVIDERARYYPSEDFDWQEQLLERSGRPAAHLLFGWQDDRFGIGDHVVRFIADPAPSAPGRRGLAETLAALGGGFAAPRSPYISWLLPPLGSGDLFPTYEIPTHPPVGSGGAGTRLIPESFRALLKDRLVLIGGAFADRDRHLTPLSVSNDEQMSGVFIHAQILAQLLDGRSLEVLSEPLELLTLLVVAGFGFLLGRRYRLKRYDFLASALGLAVLVPVGAWMFNAFQLIVPVTAIFFAWIAGITGGHYCNWALRKLGLG